MIAVFCWRCDADVTPALEDLTFSHEHGTLKQYACVCPQCGEDLPLIPEPEPEPDL